MTDAHEAEILPPELFQKIKSIQIRTQRTVNDVFAGEYESAFKGRGMEFEEVRDYQPGQALERGLIRGRRDDLRSGGEIVTVHARDLRRLTAGVLKSPALF